MQAVASLRYGVIFNKAFSQPDVFTAFVKDILDIDLIIDHVETEKSFPSPVGNVNNHFDLFAEDKVNRIIVDIQHRRYADHYHRFLHYHCAALLEQAVNAKYLNDETPEAWREWLFAINDSLDEEELRREEWDKAEKCGLERGVKLGWEEGAKNKAFDIARNLLNVLDDATIAKKTGFSETEVRVLR